MYFKFASLETADLRFLDHCKLCLDLIIILCFSEKHRRKSSQDVNICSVKNKLLDTMNTHLLKKFAYEGVYFINKIFFVNCGGFRSGENTAKLSIFQVTIQVSCYFYWSSVTHSMSSTVTFCSVIQVKIVLKTSTQT